MATDRENDLFELNSKVIALNGESVKGIWLSDSDNKFVLGSNSKKRFLLIQMVITWINLIVNFGRFYDFFFSRQYFAK